MKEVGWGGGISMATQNTRQTKNTSYGRTDSPARPPHPKPTRTSDPLPVNPRQQPADHLSLSLSLSLSHSLRTYSTRSARKTSASPVMGMLMMEKITANTCPPAVSGVINPYPIVVAKVKAMIQHRL